MKISKLYFTIVLFIGISVLVGYQIFTSERDLGIYGIRYGQSQYGSDKIYYNNVIDSDVDFAWAFYAVKYKNRVTLIDTGFNNADTIKQLNIEYSDPINLLASINISPEEVDNVIITHAHFDHIGYLSKFHGAQVIIQEDELHAARNQTYDTELAQYLNTKEDIITFQDSYQFDGIYNIEKIGGHSIGSSVVTLKYKNTEYIFTGDECYLVDNCLNNKPIGAFYNLEKNKDFINSIDLKDKQHILTFHDPQVFSEYKKIKDNIVIIK